MVVYDSSYIYITSCSDLRERIRRIDVIIDSLLNSSLETALSDDKQEYWLDDGQVKVKVVRRSAAESTNAIKQLESIKNIYLNQLNGRMVRLIDAKNFKRGF